MELLKWEDIKENEEYIDRIYGRITVHAKAIIKNEKLLVISYKDRDQFPVSFDGMKIFKEIYRVKTLEELGFERVTRLFYILYDKTHAYYLNISQENKDYVFRAKDKHDVWTEQEIHKAIELKMIELGLWKEV